MSYYSDAAAVIYKIDYDRINEKILNTVEDEWDRNDFERAEVSFKDDLVIIKWENVNHFGRGSTSMKMFLDFLNTMHFKNIILRKELNCKMNCDYELIVEIFVPICINEKKTRYAYSYQRQEVTGLIINNGNIRIKRNYIGRFADNLSRITCSFCIPNRGYRRR